MLRLNRTHKSRVSNRLAIVAAFMLMSSIVVGLDGSMIADSKSNPLASKSSFFAADTATTQASTGSQVKQKKGFKVSLFLLRIE